MRAPTQGLWPLPDYSCSHMQSVYSINFPHDGPWVTGPGQAWIIQWTISAVSLTLFVNASCQDELNHFLKAGDAIPIEICEP